MSRLAGHDVPIDAATSLVDLDCLGRTRDLRSPSEVLAELYQNYISHKDISGVAREQIDRDVVMRFSRMAVKGFDIDLSASISDLLFPFRRRLKGRQLLPLYCAQALALRAGGDLGRGGDSSVHLGPV